MKTIISLIFILLSYAASAQEFSISGQVRDKNKKPVAKANIFIEGTYDGASTDSLGLFQFKTSETGLKTLKVTAIGFLSQNINILNQSETKLNIMLLSDNQVIDEVVIQAGQFTVGNLSNTVMSSLDIVTTAGSNGNIVAALEKLPGAQIAEENGRLMVRGGSPHETQTYINGIRVAQPYSGSINGVPARGRFSPMLFKGTNFSTGGYNAEFGNALSSILNMHTNLAIEPARTEISLSNVYLGLGSTQSWNNTSITFNTSYMNLKPYSNLIPQRIQWTKPFEQLSVEAILKNKGKNHFFNLYASYGFENLGIKGYDIDLEKNVEAKVNSKIGYINSNYIQYLSNNWKWESGASYGQAKNTNNYHIYNIPSSDNHIHLKSKAQKPFNNDLQITFGAEYFYNNLNEHLADSSTNQYHYGFTQNMGATFASSKLKLWNKTHVETGLRYNTDFKKNQSIDPRINIAYIINKHSQSSFAYGKFQQNAMDDILKFKPDLAWSNAQHFILNYSYSKTKQLFRAEIYHKKYTNLIQYDTKSPGYFSQYESNGKGYAQGLDLFWKDSKSIENLQYWISYSLTNVNKTEKNYPISVQPDYVAKHYFSIVAKYWISAWKSQAGLSNTYISGRPYNNPNLSQFMSERTKAQNDLSFNWTYLLTQQKLIHLSITNVLGQNPIYGYKYSNALNPQRQYTSKAILPTAKRFIFVGFFWTISKNKKDNNLENL